MPSSNYKWRHYSLAKLCFPKMISISSLRQSLAPQNFTNVVSIIIPVYKVERFIGKCLESIKKQTFSQLEIIVVNDCSPDNTLAIVKKQAEKDNRISIVELGQNHGVSYARAIGYSKAKGEYVMFVDGDDYLPQKAVEVLVSEADRSNADVVEGTFNRVLDNWGFIKKSNTCTPIVVEHDELMRDYYISFFGVNILAVNLCGKLYRHSLIEQSGGLPITNYRMGEDLIANMIMFPHIQRYSRINKPVYNYRWGGLTSSYNKSLFSDLKEQYFVKIDYAALLSGEILP